MNTPSCIIQDLYLYTLTENDAFRNRKRLLPREKTVDKQKFCLLYTSEHAEVNRQHLGHQNGVLLLHLLGEEQAAGFIVDKFCHLKIDEISNLGAVRIRLRSLMAAIEAREASQKEGN